MADAQDTVVERLTGSSEPTGEAPTFHAVAADSVYTLSRPDAALIELASRTSRLAIEENAAEAANPGLSLNHPDQVAWAARSKLLSEDLNKHIKAVADLPAETSTGLAWKANVVLSLDRMFESMVDDGEEALVRSLAKDADRLRPRHDLLPSPPVDVPLAAAWAEYRRLMPIVDKVYEEADRLMTIAAQQRPKRPDAMIIRPTDFPRSSIRFVTDETVDDPVRYYSVKAVEHLRRNPRLDVATTHSIDTGLPSGPPELVPDVKAQARAEEIVSAYDGWRQTVHAFEKSLGLMQADRMAGDVGAALQLTGDMMRDGEARSIRGIGIKAEWLLSLETRTDDDANIVLRQIVGFAERCASPAITGRVPVNQAVHQHEADLAMKVERWVKLGLQLDEAERLEIAGNAEVRCMREEMSRLQRDIADTQVVTFRGLLLKALLLNTGQGLNDSVRQDAKKAQGLRYNSEELARRVAMDLVEMVALAPQEWPFVGAFSAAQPDRRSLEAYRTWLSNEFRSLTAEMYPDQREMIGVIEANNTGDRYHFRGEPPASSRAERMLAILGLDWTGDDAGFGDQQPQEAAA